MYHDYFGFEQVPFSIAPDPEFLFLGPRHREGLDHLRNGLSGSGGFLLLTGEVGTGKTTLSRAVMEELGDKLVVAFVVNPMLSEREMLATICDQFGIPGRHEKASLKRLTDHLSKFLLTSSAEGRHPVILIDEAQHLLPSVLEQLRLLTNLETNARKLLSIALIGQPELQELLQRRELRQVAQRIVARYHLLPLTLSEMQEYIQHRLTRVAQPGVAIDSIFPTASIKAIYQFSQGTPRLINLVCDRALQLAARAETKVVTKALVREAIQSLSLQTPSRQHRQHQPWLVRVTSAAAVVVVFAAGWWFLQSNENNAAGGVTVNEASAQQSQERRSSESTVIERTPLVGLTLPQALMGLAELWQVQSFVDDSEPCLSLQDVRLGCLQAELTLDQVITFDLPVVAEIPHEEAEQPSSYVLLLDYQRNDQGVRTWTLLSADGLLTSEESALRAKFPTSALMIWQLPPADNNDWIRSGLAARAPYSMQGAPYAAQINWLRRHLVTVHNTSRVDEDYFTPAELAYLSSGALSYGPRLSASAVGSTQALMSSSASPRQLRVGSFSGLMVPELTIARVEPSTEVGERVSAQGVAEEEEYVSDRIRTLFDSAVAEVGFDDLLNPPPPAPEPTQSGPLATFQDLTAQQRQRLPSLSYESHMYSGRNQDRWVRFDGRMLREGERYRDLRIVAIEPSHVILGFDDFLFQLEALEDIPY
ncbi:MAG: AAA family ATPase [Gammaproteobacteria bacterium]|nr:AAA family ATPase [Gammaproteobacteria bacterium]